MPAFDAPRVRQLAMAADRADAAGRLDEAAAIWRQVIGFAPDHPRALFRLGQYALFRNDPRGARELLTQSAAGAPRDPVIALNLAFASRALGDMPGEAEAVEAALTIDPYFYPALLLRGTLFERQGRKRQAARVYKDALGILPQNPPAELQDLIARAQKVVAENTEELEARVRCELAELLARHGSENLARFARCRDAFVGGKKVYACRPTLLHFPELPAIQFYERERFPWLGELETHTRAIQEEAIALLQDAPGEFRPYVDHPPGAPLNQWVELNHSPKWSAYFLWKDGVRQDAHCKRCPRTSEVVESLPLCNVPGHAPAAFFSTLEPHTTIPPHTGVTNTRLVVHLPLVVPEKCSFRVGNETRVWEPGKAWVFDDTIEHEAINESDRLRVILIFDIWNPNLTGAERELTAALMKTTQDYYAETVR